VLVCCITMTKFNDFLIIELDFDINVVTIKNYFGLFKGLVKFPKK
jgi:hypothetical protein